jgi:hypothetical protein
MILHGEMTDMTVDESRLAGKATCWHAGVLLAAPTVKRRGVHECSIQNLN